MTDLTASHPKKGFSGATVEYMHYDGMPAVAKVHPRLSLIEQALQCRFLYPVTPFVYTVTDRMYVMERLSEPTKIDTESVPQMFDKAWAVLEKYVWSNQAARRNNDWRLALCMFVRDTKNMSGINDMLDLLYPRDTGYPYGEKLCAQLTHGDPTLANMMYRGTQLCIIDPIMRSERIADHWTVDVGKMLQSAIGWEIVTLNWHYSIDHCVWHLISKIKDPIDVLRVWFWCMIHCVRIIPYTDRSSRESKWAKFCASMLHVKLEIALQSIHAHTEDPKCITRSILTEL